MNFQLKNKVLDFIQRSEGSYAYYPHFGDKVYNKLSNKDKNEIQQFLLELIDDNTLWLDAGIESNHILTCQARTIHVCALLGITDAIPKAEKFFLEKRNGLFGDGFHALYSAVGKFKMLNLLLHIIKDLDTVDWLAEKIKYQTTGKYVENIELAGKPLTAFHTILDISPIAAVEFMSRHFESIADIDDARLDLIVRAYYKEYGDGCIEHFLKKSRSNAILACGLIYGMYECWKNITEHEALIKKYYMQINENLRNEVEKMIEEDIRTCGKSTPRKGHSTVFNRIELCELLGIDLIRI
jgi:hypothetical protein